MSKKFKEKNVLQMKFSEVFTQTKKIIKRLYPRAGKCSNYFVHVKAGHT